MHRHGDGDRYHGAAAGTAGHRGAGVQLRPAAQVRQWGEGDDVDNGNSLFLFDNFTVVITVTHKHSF